MYVHNYQKKSRISFIFFVPDKKMTPKSTKKLKPPEYFFPSTKTGTLKNYLMLSKEALVTLNVLQYKNPLKTMECF